VGEFYDAAVSGADPIDARPGFAAMLKRIESNGLPNLLKDREPAQASSLIRSQHIFSPKQVSAFSAFIDWSSAPAWSAENSAPAIPPRRVPSRPVLSRAT
jgi:hypothetical protein